MAHFRVRYATNNGRFQPCSMVDEIIYSHEPATAFPQNPGRLESLLNHDKLPQSEDSFFMDIWTPKTEGELPVLFWIHGGAFVAGASGDNQNDATNLANNTNIVIVSVSYRLGILGTSNFDGISQANCGFHDIITALEWTNKFVSKFGGDPTNITIGGQSSGAWYAMAIHTSPILQHLFQKTMLFSWPGTMKASSLTIGNEINKRFEKELQNVSPKEASVEDILHAQTTIGKNNKKKYKFDVPLIPYAETDYIAENFYEAIKTSSKPVFLQYTENECGAYVYHYPIHKFTPPLIVSLFLKRYCPEKPHKRLRESRKATKNTYDSVLNITTENLFHNPAKEIARLNSHAIISKFSFETPENRTRCCHCFDIPFIFGNIENWKSSKIFAGCDYNDIHKKSQQLQQQIKCFVYQTKSFGQ